jgi:hypothetical protein
MVRICSLCKRELGRGGAGVGDPAPGPGNGILKSKGSAVCMVSRLSGLVYAESRIRGIRRIIRVSPLFNNKS